MRLRCSDVSNPQTEKILSTYALEAVPRADIGQTSLIFCTLFLPVVQCVYRSSASAAMDSDDVCVHLFVNSFRSDSTESRTCDHR